MNEDNKEAELVGMTIVGLGVVVTDLGILVTIWYVGTEGTGFGVKWDKDGTMNETEGVKSLLS